MKSHVIKYYIGVVCFLRLSPNIIIGSQKYSTCCNVITRSPSRRRFPITLRQLKRCRGDFLVPETVKLPKTRLLRIYRARSEPWYIYPLGLRDRYPYNFSSIQDYSPARGKKKAR